MTLDECAHCVQQLNIDLQRQTDAFRYFRAAADNVARTAKGEKVPERLPFVSFTYPTAQQHYPAVCGSPSKPAEYKLDLGDMMPDQLAAMAPMYDALVDNAGDALLMAWTRLIKIVEIAKPQVNQALYPVTGQPVNDFRN